MARLSFDLYLDENDNFEKDANEHSMVSLVGGLLIPSSKITIENRIPLVYFAYNEKKILRDG